MKNLNEMSNTELLKELHTSIILRADWWKINPDYTQGIHSAVIVAMVEVANAVNNLLVRDSLSKE